jgi:hypothetical protein
VAVREELMPWGDGGVLSLHQQFRSAVDLTPLGDVFAITDGFWVLSNGVHTEMWGTGFEMGRA